VAVTAGCAYLDKIVADLAVAVALGGDCLADAAMLRAEPALFGPVASGRVISRLISRLAGDADAALTALGQGSSPAAGTRTCWADAVRRCTRCARQPRTARRPKRSKCWPARTRR